MSPKPTAMNDRSSEPAASSPARMSVTVYRCSPAPGTELIDVPRPERVTSASVLGVELAALWPEAVGCAVPYLAHPPAAAASAVRPLALGPPERRPLPVR